VRGKKGERKKKGKKEIFKKEQKAGNACTVLLNYVGKLFVFPVAYAMGVILDCERREGKETG